MGLVETICLGESLVVAAQRVAIASHGYGCVVDRTGQWAGIVRSTHLLTAVTVALTTGQGGDGVVDGWVERAPQIPVGADAEAIAIAFSAGDWDWLPQVDGQGQVIDWVPRPAPSWMTEAKIIEILESITDGFFALDENFCFTYVNHQAELLIRHSRNELLGKNIWQMYPAAVETTFKTAYEVVIRDRKTQVFEAFYPPFEAWYEVHAYPTSTGLISYFQDITERKKIYEQLTHQVQREKILNRVVQVIHQSLDLTTVFSTVVESVSPALGGSNVAVIQYEPTQGEWQVRASFAQGRALVADNQMTIPDHPNPLADQLRRGEMVVIDNTQVELHDPVNQTLVAGNPESWMLIPLMVPGRSLPWGAMGISRLAGSRSPAWLPTELDLAQTIAQQVAIAVYQAQTYEQAQRELKERQRAEDRLREAQALARLGNWELDVATQQWIWSEQMYALFGVAGPEPPTLAEQLQYFHPEDQPIWQETLEIAQLTGKSFQVECRLWDGHGEERFVSLLGDAEVDEQETVIRLFGTLMDITERRRFEDQLTYEAYHDALTGVPNRSYFMEYLHAASRQAQMAPGEYHFAVLFLDLDRFKTINDSLGHMAGDRLLIACTQRLTHLENQSHLLARLSGDEFAILMEDIPDESAPLALIEQIQAALRRPFLVEGRELWVSVSIGITTSFTGPLDPMVCLRNADVAMFQAKEKGRNRYVVFDPAMDADHTTRLILETDLQRAIEREELAIAYQPIVSLKTGKILGFEALMRWHHPQFGLVPPLQFITLAEETGIILDIGHWIRHQACLQLKEWQSTLPQAAHLSMSVNLSPKQFASSTLVKRIEQTLRETQVQGHHLRLEITESALIDNPEQATTILQQLHQKNIRLCIDDFGTGYSSLSMVHQYPVQVLKIDRSFVHRIEVDERGIAMVRTIVGLAHSLGMETVAEGIETLGQLHILQALGCEAGQGYYFSPPLPASQVTPLLSYPPQWLGCF